MGQSERQNSDFAVNILTPLFLIQGLCHRRDKQTSALDINFL